MTATVRSIYVRSTLLVVILNFVSGCKHGEIEASGTASSPVVAAPPAVSSAAFLAGALAGMAHPPAGSHFYLTSLPLAVGATVGFDFSPLAGWIADPEIIPGLSKLLQFSVPAGILPGPGVSLNNDAFARAFGASLESAYNPVAHPSGSGTSSSFQGLADIIASRRQACSDAGSPPTVDLTATETTFGADYTVKLDCRFFLRQPGSGEVVTLFEMASVETYTGDQFRDINSLLRQRTFPDAVGDPTGDAHAPRDAINGMWSLGTLSTLDKIDTRPMTTYRGINRVFPPCSANALPVPTASGRTAQDAANYCAYFVRSPQYRDCGFSSSSLDPDVAVMFAGQAELADVGDDGVTFKDKVPPTTALGVVVTLHSLSGVSIAPISMIPYEQEVLFKPGVPFQVDPSSLGVALFPAHAAANGHTAFGAFEVVPCGTAMTTEQQARISHFRVTFAEASP